MRVSFCTVDEHNDSALVCSEVINSTVHLFDEIKRGTTSAKCAPVLGVVWSACNTMKAMTLDNKVP